MDLGAFSISLAVRDLAASRTFYEKFGVTVFAGDCTAGGEMSWGVRQGVTYGFAFFATCQALAQENLAARVKTAQDAARENAASTQGREWMQRNSSAAGRLMIPVLNQCLPDPPGDIPTAFSVYVRLSQKGRASEVVTELDASLGKCMTAAARKMPFPEAPRDDYWIQVNMAAPL
jgi:hypothetical protein